jgi:hypothetical protein
MDELEIDDDFIRAIVRNHIKTLDNALETLLEQILVDNDVDMSDDETKDEILILAKQVYFAG